MTEPLINIFSNSSKNDQKAYLLDSIRSNALDKRIQAQLLKIFKETPTAPQPGNASPLAPHSSVGKAHTIANRVHLHKLCTQHPCPSSTTALQLLLDELHEAYEVLSKKGGKEMQRLRTHNRYQNKETSLGQLLTDAYHLNVLQASGIMIASGLTTRQDPQKLATAPTAPDDCAHNQNTLITTYATLKPLLSNLGMINGSSRFIEVMRLIHDITLEEPAILPAPLTQLLPHLTPPTVEQQKKLIVQRFRCLRKVVAQLEDFFPKGQLKKTMRQAIEETGNTWKEPLTNLERSFSQIEGDDPSSFATCCLEASNALDLWYPRNHSQLYDELDQILDEVVEGNAPSDVHMLIDVASCSRSIAAALDYPLYVTLRESVQMCLPHLIGAAAKEQFSPTLLSITSLYRTLKRTFIAVTQEVLGEALEPLQEQQLFHRPLAIQLMQQQEGLYSETFDAVITSLRTATTKPLDNLEDTAQLIWQLLDLTAIHLANAEKRLRTADPSEVPARIVENTRMTAQALRGVRQHLSTLVLSGLNEKLQLKMQEKEKQELAKAPPMETSQEKRRAKGKRKKTVQKQVTASPEPKQEPARVINLKAKGEQPLVAKVHLTETKPLKQACDQLTSPLIGEEINHLLVCHAALEELKGARVDTTFARLDLTRQLIEGTLSLIDKRFNLAPSPLHVLHVRCQEILKAQQVPRNVQHVLRLHQATWLTLSDSNRALHYPYSTPFAHPLSQGLRHHLLQMRAGVTEAEPTQELLVQAGVACAEQLLNALLDKDFGLKIQQSSPISLLPDAEDALFAKPEALPATPPQEASQQLPPLAVESVTSPEQAVETLLFIRDWIAIYKAAPKQMEEWNALYHTLMCEALSNADLYAHRLIEKYGDAERKSTPINSTLGTLNLIHRLLKELQIGALFYHRGALGMEHRFENNVSLLNAHLARVALQTPPMPPIWAHMHPMVCYPMRTAHKDVEPLRQQLFPLLSERAEIFLKGDVGSSTPQKSIEITDTHAFKGLETALQICNSSFQ